MTSRCQGNSSIRSSVPTARVCALQSPAFGEAFGRRKGVLSSVAGNCSPSCYRVTDSPLELLHSGSRRQSSTRSYGSCSLRAFFRARLPRGRLSAEPIPLRLVFLFLRVRRAWGRDATGELKVFLGVWHSLLWSSTRFWLGSPSLVSCQASLFIWW